MDSVTNHRITTSNPIYKVKPMKYKTDYKYAKHARKLFCKGTCFVAPIDVVLSGKRTLEEWADVLAQERELAKYGQAFKTSQSKGIG